MYHGGLLTYTDDSEATILPFDVSVDGKYTAHHRRFGMILQCYFDQGSIRSKHFLQLHARGSNLCIRYCGIV